MLSTLGQRESGTAKLEEAVVAYREALKELARERVALQWAREVESDEAERAFKQAFEHLSNARSEVEAL